MYFYFLTTKSIFFIRQELAARLQGLLLHFPYLCAIIGCGRKYTGGFKKTACTGGFS